MRLQVHLLVIQILKYYVLQFGAVDMTPEKLQRVKNDNRRLLALTERINKQRSDIETKLKEKKQEIGECNKEINSLKVRSKFFRIFLEFL